MELLIQVLSAFAGSLGFALLFNVKGVNVLLSSLGGALAWSVYLLVWVFSENAFLLSFCAAAFAAMYAEALARIRKTPATIFTVIAIIPLVPGSSLYYTLLSVISQNSSEAFAYGTGTLLSACGIAVGVVAVSVVVKTLSDAGKSHKQCKR